MRSKPMPPNLDSPQVVALETAITSAATKWGMGGGTAAAALGWLSSSAGAVFIGVLITILGFIINGIYQRRRDRREAAVEKREVEEAAFRRGLEMAEEARRVEMHQAQLLSIRLLHQENK